MKAIAVLLLLSVNAHAGFPLDPPTDHPWTAFAMQQAQGEPYGEAGQWDHLAWRITGDPKWARDAIVRGELFPLKPGSRNTTREDSMHFALLYEWLKPHMTDAERATWESKLNNWAMFMLALAPEPGGGTRAGDSDETVGHYFGLRLIDRALGSKYCERTGLANTADAAQMREAIRGFIVKAKGGEWIENGQKYNWGTLRLLLTGYAAVGPEEFPEITAWLPELAEQLTWVHTADGKDVVQWGDIEDPHGTEPYKFVTVASMVIGLGGDKTGKLSHLLADFIKDKEPKAYGFRLNSALYVFDPRTLPANPVRPNPQGLRATGVGLVLYRKGETLVQLMLPNQIGVDHEQSGQNLRIYDGGEWIVDSPLGYGSGPLNRPLAFGFDCMDASKQLVEAKETADGFTATWRTGGALRTPGIYWSPPVFVDLMETVVTYTHATRSLSIEDRFQGTPPPDPKLIADGGLFYPYELSKIEGAPTFWQRIHHCKVQPTATADGFTWTTKGGRTMRLTTNGKCTSEKVVQWTNLVGWFHAPEAGGWLMRLGSDEVPKATIRTTIGPAVTVEPPPPPVEPPPVVDVPVVTLPSRVELRRFPDRIERVEVFPIGP